MILFFLKEAEFKYLHKNKNKFVYYDLITRILFYKYKTEFNTYNITYLNRL